MSSDDKKLEGVLDLSDLEEVSEEELLKEDEEDTKVSDNIQNNEKDRKSQDETDAPKSEKMEDGAEDDSETKVREAQPHKQRRKRRKKKVQEVIREDEKTPEEDEDSWLYSDGDDILDDDYQEHHGRGRKIFLITLASIVGVLAVAYIGVSVFFMSHFYYNTTINGENFSLKTTADVEKYIKSEVQGYELTVIEKDNVREVIKGADIDLAYVENGEVKKALDKQNAFLWPTGFFSKNSAKVEIEVSHDRDKLTAKIQALKCISEVPQTDPVNATPVYQNGAFVVQKEQTGTKVDQEKLIKEANDYVNSFESELDMEKDECYVMPAYTTESPEVQAACDKMNNYCKASITYDMSPNTEVVNKDLISSWLTCDANMNVTFNTDAVAGYMSELAGKYDTVGKARTITTPGGKSVEVSGGTYGWSIDEATETQNLITSIQNGEVATRTPAYAQTAATHDAVDWGNTYLEVDLSSQHMWYVSDGAVALETDVVTGDGTNPNKMTPSGVYQVLEKLSPTILKGEIQAATGKPEYETEVTFWIRVTWSGIGFHDATWQSSFGGSRYLDGAGSHGCINMPYSVVQSLYGMVSVGCPIIVHY